MTAPSRISDRLEKHLPPELLAFARDTAAVAAEKKTTAVFVGGVVRDLLLGRSVVDADIMIEPPSAPVAEEMARRTRGKLVSHASFLTYSLTLPAGRKIDLVTAREETYPQPAALPRVTPAKIETDLRRRDFSINALVCRLSPEEGEIYDPLGGRADLEAGVIRALHDQSFVDDPTRIFRAARFAGRLGFRIEARTAGWIADALKSGVVERLSPVRRRHEFELVLKESAPVPALKILKSWSALRYFSPEWDRADISKLSFDGKAELPDRLASWLRPFGPAAAEKMMAALAFERAVKRKVADLLAGKN